MKDFTFVSPDDVDIVMPEEPKEVVKKKHVFKASILNEKVSINYKIPTNIVDTLGISIYEYINYLNLLIDANMGVTSNYYEELINNDIASYNTSSYAYQYDSYIVICLTNTPKDNRREDFIKLTEKYMNNLIVNIKDIDRKIKCEISDYILSFDDNVTVVNMITEDIVKYNKLHDNYLQIYKEFNEDIGNKIIKSLDLSNKSIVIMEPKD